MPEDALAFREVPRIFALVGLVVAPLRIVDGIPRAEGCAWWRIPRMTWLVDKVESHRIIVALLAAHVVAVVKPEGFAFSPKTTAHLRQVRVSRSANFDQIETRDVSQHVPSIPAL